MFARAPVLGEVKTRLAQSLGAAAALALYEAFLDDTCALTAGRSARGACWRSPATSTIRALAQLAKSQRLRAVRAGRRRSRRSAWRAPSPTHVVGGPVMHHRLRCADAAARASAPGARRAHGRTTWSSVRPTTAATTSIGARAARARAVRRRALVDARGAADDAGAAGAGARTRCLPSWLRRRHESRIWSGCSGAAGALPPSVAPAHPRALLGSCQA